MYTFWHPVWFSSVCIVNVTRLCVQPGVVLNKKRKCRNLHNKSGSAVRSAVLLGISQRVWQSCVYRTALREQRTVQYYGLLMQVICRKYSTCISGTLTRVLPVAAGKGDSYISFKLSLDLDISHVSVQGVACSNAKRLACYVCISVIRDKIISLTVFLPRYINVQC